MEIVVLRCDRFGSETMKYDFNKSMIELNRLCYFFPCKETPKGLIRQTKGWQSNVIFVNIFTVTILQFLSSF